MTESDWATCTDPRPMLSFLRDRAASERKVRLFAVTCCERIRVHLAGHTYVVSPGPRSGIKPIHPGRTRPASSTLSLHSSAPTGVVSPHPRVYLVFWGTQWSSDPAGAAGPRYPAGDHRPPTALATERVPPSSVQSVLPKRASLPRRPAASPSGARRGPT